MNVGLITAVAVAGSSIAGHSEIRDYEVVDTRQANCFDTDGNRIYPEPGDALFGQDAQHAGVAPSYRDNGDGTVTDLVTGLMWQKTPSEDKLRWTRAVEFSEQAEFAGYDDWRLPTAKELFSISLFDTGWPYLDSTYFSTAGSTVTKDQQYWTSHLYPGTTHGGAVSAFGVNHATGHIKAYPAGDSPRAGKLVRLVRGKPYGVNDFHDNGNGTVTDRASGLMWAQQDSIETMDWPSALAYASASSLGGHSDWRLPSVKELQSIVDYSKAPNATDQASLGPAINSAYFGITPLAEGVTQTQPDYGYYWTSTSAFHSAASPDHVYAWYVAFGTAPNANGTDIHGAGAVRFDAKVVANKGEVAPAQEPPADRASGPESGRPDHAGRPPRPENGSPARRGGRNGGPPDRPGRHGGPERERPAQSGNPDEERVLNFVRLVRDAD